MHRAGCAAVDASSKQRGSSHVEDGGGELDRPRLFSTPLTLIFSFPMVLSELGNGDSEKRDKGKAYTEISAISTESHEKVALQPTRKERKGLNTGRTAEQEHADPSWQARSRRSTASRS